MGSNLDLRAWKDVVVNCLGGCPAATESVIVGMPACSNSSFILY